MLLKKETPRRVKLLSSVCAQKEMEGYPSFQHLKYRATRSLRQKVGSLSACAQLDGKEQHGMLQLHIHVFLVL